MQISVPGVGELEPGQRGEAGKEAEVRREGAWKANNRVTVRASRKVSGSIAESRAEG